MAFYRKNFIKNGRCLQSQVPLQFRTIFQSPESRNLIVQNAVESEFLQAENESFVAFFCQKNFVFLKPQKFTLTVHLISVAILQTALFNSILFPPLKQCLTGLSQPQSVFSL